MSHISEAHDVYLPVLLNRKNESDNQLFLQLVEVHSKRVIADQFASQKKEIFKIRNPKQRLSAEQIDTLYDEFAKDKNIELEGIWVYYPWVNSLVHTLGKAEFIELRTSRNQYRITAAEQQSLSEKKIGIIGLSIGHSVALSMATERICGKLKLADFDVLELSNLNRIRTGIRNIGLNKCIVTAREISEIDPFIEIECYTEGINEGNLQDFLLGKGKLDILVDECDSLEIKISAREEAKRHHIPVIMETSDRGMLDVERFDIETGRPVFHGLLSDVPPEKLKNISPGDRIPLVLKIVNASNGSTRGKVSMLEVGQTISTWPQLASAATLGGAIVTDVTRRILLDHFRDSGRYYVDLEQIISNESKYTEPVFENPNEPFQIEKAIQIADTFSPAAGTSPELSAIEKIVEAASQAPSSANDQPWKWLFRSGRLFLFHDTFKSYSFANFNNSAAYIAFGAAFENILLKSAELGLSVEAKHFPEMRFQEERFPEERFPELISCLEFTNTKTSDAVPVFSPESAAFIAMRSTNRSPSSPVEIPDDHLDILQNAAKSISGADLIFVLDKSKMVAIGRIIGECDRLVMLHPHGHQDYFERDLKWPGTDRHAQDGMDIRTMGMGPAQAGALSLIRDKKIAATLKEIGGGRALVDATMFAISKSSGIGIITLPAHSKENFFLAGMAMERLWLKAEKLGYAIHPMMSPLILFPRLATREGLSSSEADRLKELKKSFLQIIDPGENRSEMFIFKIAMADKPAIKTNRLPLSEILFIANKE